MLNIQQALLLSLIISIGSSTLRVINPPELKKQLDYPLDYSIANFGHIPYGRTQSGQIIQLTPEGQEENYLCAPLQSSSNTSTTSSIPGVVPAFSPVIINQWFLVHRGGCSFTRKAINAQNAGASMLIIVDTVNELPEYIIMGNDGYGYQVNIPTIIIKKKDGDILMDYLKSPRPQVDGMSNSVSAVISFNETNKWERPSVLLGLTLQNRETFKLVRDFKQYYLEMKNDVDFNLYYELLPCWVCQFQGFKQPQSNCLGGGRYCNLDPDGVVGKGTGRDVVYEQLRQYCLFQQDKDFWWDYMDQFDQDCILPQDYERCSQKILESKKQDLSHKINSCVVNSFDSNDNSLVQELQNNTFLDQWLELKQISGIIYYPGATVNNVTYRGNVEAYDIAEDICSGMVKTTQFCSIFDTNFNVLPQTTNQTSYIGLLIFVVIVCAFFLLFMTLVYRRMLRRELSQEMGSQVNQMVSQYISFYESKSARQQTE